MNNITSSPTKKSLDTKTEKITDNEKKVVQTEKVTIEQQNIPKIENVPKQIINSELLEQNNNFPPLKESVSKNKQVTPSEVHYKIIGKIAINKNQLLGKGSGGTTVYDGKYEDKIICAVKVLSKIYVLKETTFLPQ